MTGIAVSSLYGVLCCGTSTEEEIIKSTLVKALLQIDRSSQRGDLDIIAECSYFLGIEARANSVNAAALLQRARLIRAIR